METKLSIILISLKTILYTTHTYKKHLYYPFSCTLQIYASGSALLQRGGLLDRKNAFTRRGIPCWSEPELFAVGCDCTRIVASFCAKHEPEASTNEMAGAPKRNLIVNGPDREHCGL